jgi:ATP/maltotriose-dependent transcriptional regulator MalT
MQLNGENPLGPYDDMHSFALARTKLELSVDYNNLVKRPRLSERPADSAKVSITVLQEPAGYGKTSLRFQWYAAVKSSGKRIGWVTAMPAYSPLSLPRSL